MNLSRQMDIRAKQALPEGAVTAPESIRAQTGNCAECNSAISTHGYELTIETASCENPKFQDKQYESIVLCEKCYHRFSERSFLLKTIEEVGCIANVIGLLLVIVGFFLLKNNILGGLGVTLLVLPSLARYPAKRVRERRNKEFLFRHFPQVKEAKHVSVPSPWWTNSAALCVPSAFAVVVHSNSPIRQISTDDLARILRGDKTSWSDVGGTDHNINLYIPVGPWREWSFLKKTYLSDAELGSHMPLQHPIEVLEKLQKDVDGLGFISFTYIDLFGEQIRPLSIDDEECVKDNSNYPLWMMPKLFPVTEMPSSTTA